MSQFQLTPHKARYYSWVLTRQAEGGSMDALATTLIDAQVDLNPHQVDAALFACKNPLSKGVILADEVGLGKTIEAGLVILHHWAERRQWHQELQEKFGLQGMILEDAKNRALLTALSTVFAKLKELGAKQKAIIFTESKYTQAYPLECLAQTDYTLTIQKNLYACPYVLPKPQ